jgi:VIT1/CCC1 family predicted Fe2+/Mn2+ transporter
MSAVVRDEKSLGQLFSELAVETRMLIRQEVDLAKTEMTQKATFVGKNVASAAAGALVLLMGALPLIAAVIIGLGHAIGYGFASLLVGVILVIVGAVLVMKAKNALAHGSLAPQQTTTQIKETTQWAKEQMK